MDTLRGILTAAGVAALAAAASGSLYYLYRSRAQKPTTTEKETAVTPVEGDPETVKETQAEAEAMAPLVMDEASEAASLLPVTDLAETAEAEVTEFPEICESVVETLVEDGGVTSPQEEDQAPLVMDEASEAASLLPVTDLAETEEAEVTEFPEICESVVETLVEDGEVTGPQEEDQASPIMDEAPEAASLLLDTDLAETEEAEVIMEPELCDSVMEKVEENGGVEVEWLRPPEEEDETKAQPLPSVYLTNRHWCLYIAEPKEQRQPRRKTRETVVRDGEVAPSCPQMEDQASEAPILLMDSDLAETKEAKAKADDEQPLTSVDQSSIEAEPKKKQRRRGTRGRGRKINYKKDKEEEGK
ncbi:uncharacterized protein LOC125781288 [Astyanax mexicanus]|uniref:uncharacterized protein LOC125781288 n=1 Tax=Astyanax mexicanus TaxID=7994 RepID=UPI0020CB4C53|nr:uncharacterized protein LOC125781288 [Astyanax mexicanus]